MNFLKNNLVALIVCFLVFSGLSYASVLTRPYTSADYAGGAKAVGSKVNAEFANIVNWINGGNIASGNIAALGVATSNLQDASVTTPKIADRAVTRDKLAAMNLVVTTTSSSYRNITDISTDIANLTGSITTTGNPVIISLQSANTPYLVSGVLRSWGLIIASKVGLPQLSLLRNASTIALHTVYNNNASGALATGIPCSSVSFMDQPAAGTYTYKMQGYVDGADTNSSLEVDGCQLVIRELH